MCIALHYCHDLKKKYTCATKHYTLHKNIFFKQSSSPMPSMPPMPPIPPMPPMNYINEMPNYNPI